MILVLIESCKMNVFFLDDFEIFYDALIEKFSSKFEKIGKIMGKLAIFS